ncbi:helicase-associated domain-containing protein [Marihabitans asiaticum]|uniref:XPB/Ssl2-like helicase family protein n=1 Tax=Marihabitans asiaticum TaxID=415218 RepID=A0A560WI40_9MICO|nr:XPB/Ssl2-like helicase family protein [Marihabitans asiaticum]
MVRSLADDLRARSDEELRRLLVLRPDLARPAPSDVTALCARAATLASTTRAVDHLAEERLDVLVGCAALEGAERAALDGVDEPVAAGLVELTGLTGEGVSAHLLELRDAALLWRSPDGLRPTRAVLEALGPYPGGLGPPATELELDHLTDAEIRAQHAEAPSAAARVLERLADAGPVATVAAQEQSGEAARWLADAGLAAVSPDPADGARLRVVLPREVVVALRGGSLRRREEPTAKGASPGSSTLHRSGVAHDPEAAGAAVVLDVVALVDEVLEHLESARPRVLRSGGLAVADLRALARETSLEPLDLRFLLDVALGARLLAEDTAGDPTWRLTTLVDTWREAPTAQRWVDLVRPWLTSLRTSAPPLEDPAAARALSEDLVWPPIRGLRADLLAGLAEATEPVDDAAATRLLGTRRPRRMPRDAERVVSSVLGEAARLGVLVDGVLTEAARRLVDGDPAGARDALAERLPAPVEHALVQADLTAVVPGPPSPHLAELLRHSAVLESRGGASTYRFTQDSVRGALDAGMDGEQLLDQLAAASPTPLPQALDYLVRDVARRHGQLRAGGVGSYLRSDDEAHLGQLLANRELSHLQLRRIAPTVLVSPVAAGTLVESLREVGAAPVRESSGGVISAPSSARRVAPPRVPAPADQVAADTGAVVSAMRRGEERLARRVASATTSDAAGAPAIPPMDPAGVAALLREAAADRVPVWVGVADSIGEVRTLRLVPDAVEGGRVRGTVEDSPRTFGIHRITGVAPTTPSP